MDVEGYGVFVTDGGSDKLFRCPLVERLAHFGWYGNVPGTADTAAAFGGYGESDGELIGPGDVALGPDGLLFVAEAAGITAFTRRPGHGGQGPTLEFSHKWGRRGDGPSEFRQVGGLAVCNGELFVCDVRNHRVQAFVAETGAFARAFGSKGERPGQFRRPSAIAAVRGSSSTTHGAHRLVVAEMTGKRLQVLTLMGAPLQLLSLLHPATGLPVRASCMCVDESRSRLYVAEAARAARLRVLRIR